MANVTTRRFFRLMLLLPVLFALLGLVIPSLQFFFVALFFGGVPYIPICILFAAQVRRAQSKKRIALVSLLIPLAFTPLVAIYVWVVGSGEGTRNLTIGEVTTQLAPVAAFAIVLGYFYVALSWILWVVFKQLRLVQDEFAT